MLRLAALGVAAVALAALTRQGKRGKKKGSRRKERLRDAAPEVDMAAMPAGAGDLGGQQKPAPQLLPPPPARRSPPAQWAQLLLRFLLSLAFSVALHVGMGRGTPWPAILISSTALFVLTESLQQRDVLPSTVGKVTNHATRKPQAERPPPAAVVALQDFSGNWVKDKEASDSMEEACQLMRMNALLRTAVRLIKGLRIRQGSGEFEFSVLSGILWFKVTEKYPLDGGARSFKRRDLRGGKHTASVHALPTGALQTRLSWPDPCGGTGTDTYFCPTPDTLWVDSVIHVGGGTAKYRQVYRREG